ncbi:MAG: hypothetical protein MJ212_03475 [Alphaproteobacteria bacterium]|nr:hypothetical protein [Alphaproteobacteria bacterium]
MFQDKVKQAISDTFKLLWSFKWYVGLYLLYYIISGYTLIAIPAENDPVLNYEYTRGAWNYINQEVYIGSMKLYFTIDTLIFLIGTSNMRNHPLLAKIIFASPWIVMLLGTFVIICEGLFGLVG